MKIAFSTIYGNTYTEDKLFDNGSCVIGENLLMPDIILKNELEKEGHEVHTADIMDYCDVIIFHDIPLDSWLTAKGLVEKAKYFLKGKWKRDYLYRAVKQLPAEKIILQINEPPTVAPQSYNKRFHHYFGKILTWNDSLVDNIKYMKFTIPQYWNGKKYNVSFEDKHDFVMVAGNKSCNHPNELYSRRREVINFFEENADYDFSLFGFGWEKENYKNYRGCIKQKIRVLSNYKFCFCLENIKDCSGYITEKIFDCFFANCVPIYLGANNIEKYVDKRLYIDMRDFNSIEEVVKYAREMEKKTYDKITGNIYEYLINGTFQETFGCNKYVQTIRKILTE